MATKITSIGNHAAAFWMDRASFLLSGFVKGVKVPVCWNYLPAVELMLKNRGKNSTMAKTAEKFTRRLGLIWMLANFLMSVKM
ncbi:hypothetical protein IE985_17270 [Klebsiella pneumoniae]|nr:hypothetical protein [Klebsiella pneumoniae]